MEGKGFGVREKKSKKCNKDSERLEDRRGMTWDEDGKE